MALPGLGDLVEVAAVHTFGPNDEQINVWHLKIVVAGTGTEADFSSDLIDLFSAMYGSIAGQVVDDVVATELRWRNITDDGPTVFVPWTGSYDGGVASGDPLPPGDCMLILMRTGTKGVQGKKYLPTFSEATQTSGIWGAGTLTAMDTLVDVLSAQTGLTTTEAEVTFHVYSRTLGDSFPCIAAQARPLVAYQRRRRQGRGS